ncbi:MAG: CPBP family intramembrane metalloprotease [Luteococcus sp.]|uniref:CPBP family intramembrane glutamic endopeptidase n=1 Tax=Luteococcus sp. TaxID=1969402 RepID=UPI002649520C|nr:CPBP family intramembrane glutamic endopeptidase [Luteococcus sp.]MDN5562347.1 CPBP family intramembrane metalloprotease [Luteococcus sp.]
MSQRPPAGVDFSRVLTGPGQSGLRAGAGVMVALVLFGLAVPLVAQLVTWLGWLLAGSPGGFSAWAKEASRFEHPAGLVGAHLGLALLTVIGIALVRFLHGREAVWATSVQPGMRWRYLLLCLPVAAVVLNGVLLLGRIGQSWHLAPQAQIWVWLVAVLLTAPLQAAGEEYFFRGYLLQTAGSVGDGVGLRPEHVRWFAVVVSALVFALFHGVQNVPLFVDRFGFGLLAGALVIWTGGLEAGIACHVVNNLFAFGWAAFSGGIAQSRALQAIGWANAASDLVGFSLFAAIAWWLSRRMNLATSTPRGLSHGPDLARQHAVR